MVGSEPEEELDDAELDEELEDELDEELEDELDEELEDELDDTPIVVVSSRLQSP
jgi:hypothetical protein